MSENTTQRTPQVGDHIVYHDERGRAHNALVEAAWGPTCCNLVFVSGDETRTDQYGRQKEHRSSSCHVSGAGAHGNYWRWPDETPRPYSEPTSV